MSSRIISLTSLLLACVLGNPVAEAAAIHTNLYGSETLKVSGAGYDIDWILVENFTMSGGSWSATCDGIYYHGTYKTSGKNFKLKFSSESKKALRKEIQKWAEEIVGAKVNITHFKIVGAKGSFNSAKTGVNKLRLKVKAKGKSKGKSGKATYTSSLS